MIERWQWVRTLLTAFRRSSENGESLVCTPGSLGRLSSLMPRASMTFDLPPRRRLRDASSRRTGQFACNPSGVQIEVNEVRGERERGGTRFRVIIFTRLDFLATLGETQTDLPSSLHRQGVSLVLTTAAADHVRTDASARKQRSRANIEGSPRGRTDGRASRQTDKRARRTNTGVGGPALRIASTRLPTDVEVTCCCTVLRTVPSNSRATFIDVSRRLALSAAGNGGKNRSRSKRVVCLTGAHAYATHSAAHWFARASARTFAGRPAARSSCSRIPGVPLVYRTVSRL